MIAFNMLLESQFYIYYINIFALSNVNLKSQLCNVPNAIVNFYIL